MIKNRGLAVEEASDINIEQREMEYDVVNDKNTDTDLVKEQAEDLRHKSQVPYDMKEQTSTSKVTDLARPLKRNPNAPVVGPALKSTVRSRYRCATTGSCHDFCKYGHKIELKKETKRPLVGMTRESRPLIRTASGDNLVKSVPEKEAKNKALFRRLSHPGPILEKDSPSQTEGANSFEGVTLSPPQSEMKRVQNKIKPSAVLTPENSISRCKIDVPAVKKTLQVKTSRKVKEIKTKAKEPMSNSPRTLLKKSSSIKATLLKNLKSFSRSRRQSNSEDAKFDKSRDVPDMFKPNEESHVSTTKKANGNKKGTRFGLPSFSSPSASKSVDSAAQETSESQGENQQKSDTIDTKQKRSGTSHQEGNDGSVWKVKFRRGTVVNLPTTSNSPRKLRFKKGNFLGQDQNGTTETHKSLKNIDYMTNESPDTKPEPEKVLLRRQEATGKKDSIDLNNVIKETASKLVKTRKSKVKALVGAFESVMSFRDRKPLVETTAS